MLCCVLYLSVVVVVVVASQLIRGNHAMYRAYSRMANLVLGIVSALGQRLRLIVGPVTLVG